MKQQKISAKDLPSSLSTDETVIKAMKAIQRAGFWALAVGIILIVTLGVLLVALPEYLGPLAYVYPFVAIFMIVSGLKLNKLEGGKEIRTMLIANLLVGLLLTRGIFPIILVIMSIIALTNVKHYMAWYAARDDAHPEPHAPSTIRTSTTQPGSLSTPSSNTPLIVTLAVIGLVVVIAAAASYFSRDSSEDMASPNFLSSTMMEPYTAAEHTFRANFPGFPETDRDSVDVEGMIVPLTQYSKFYDNDSKGYMVQVSEYPASQLKDNFERSMIDGAINGMGRSMGFMLLSSTNDGTHTGYPSGTATYNVTQDSETYQVHALNIVRGSDLYTLMSIGVSEADFNQFIDSFEFL